ncbi:hypothetical protein H6G51_09515 [Limnothrix sp. FACHB-708]|uniref:hypothetical protein n=1 Tax=unclassified Limnothrix TaxID=2632864 RepID=UPI001686DDF6|nr:MULTISPECIES: hypothetical protein [unclassified Limnothrix]MBD2553513.1 hypothetical protein [Limnothrix sp. FACHB-708]MBD2590552.1 hypothetical protein [Limnothrix sp. FACHB-406]
MTAQSSVLDLARQGDPMAIARLMNQSLEPAGVQVRTDLIQDCLTVMAAGELGPPDQDFLVDFVRRGMLGLAAPVVRRVVVQGYAPGAAAPSWQMGIDLQGAGTIAPRPLVTQPSSRSRRAGGARSGQPSERSVVHTVAATDATLSTPRVIGWVSILALAIGATAAARWAIAWLGETNIYEVAYVGHFLRSLEILELLNLLVFAVLGMGAGIAAGVLPPPRGQQLTALVLAVAVPGLFAIAPAVRQQAWINRAADHQRITPEQAKIQVERFLSKQVGQSGLWGFYTYSARYPELPLAPDAMREIPTIDRQVKATLANLLRWQTKSIEQLLEGCTWGVRGFYLLLAVLTTLTHFQQGLRYGWRWFGWR